MADSYTNPNTVNDATNKNVVGEGAGYVNNGVITAKRPKGPGSYKARTFSRMNPLDFEPDVALGLSLPFNDPNGRLFDLNYLSIDQALTNLNNLLLTRKGERVMHSNLGTNIPVLQGQLFEPITREETFENMRLEIETAIETYLPYIRILNIKMITQNEEPNLGDNKIRINMTYSIADQSALADNVDITLNNPEN